MFQKFFKPGEKLGVRCVDELFRLVARAVQWRTKYQCQYSRDDSTLTITTPDPADLKKHDERDLGHVEAVAAILPALLGLMVAEYTTLMSGAVPDDIAVWIDLAGVAILYLLAAGAMARLFEFRIETTATASAASTPTGAVSGGEAA